MTRETYSVACVSPRCRFAVVYLRSRDEAEAQARHHAVDGHQVTIRREVSEVIATVGATCEVRS